MEARLDWAKMLAAESVYAMAVLSVVVDTDNSTLAKKASLAATALRAEMRSVFAELQHAAPRASNRVLHLLSQHQPCSHLFRDCFEAPFPISTVKGFSPGTSLSTYQPYCLSHHEPLVALSFFSRKSTLRHMACLVASILLCQSLPWRYRCHRI